MKLYEVAQLFTLGSKIKQTDMPLKIGYRFCKLFDALEKDYAFFSDKIKEITSKYADLNEDGSFQYTVTGDIKLKIESITTAQKELNELYAVEVIKPDIHFTLDELEFIKLNVSEINCLMPFIEE